MSSTTTSSSGVSLGFLEFLTLIFITLKLTGYIDWSWWWVLAPLWIQIGIFLFAFMVIVIYAATRKPTLSKQVKDYSDALKRK